MGLWELFTVLDTFVLCPDVVFPKKRNEICFFLFSVTMCLIPAAFFNYKHYKLFALTSQVL